MIKQQRYYQTPGLSKRSNVNFRYDHGLHI